MSESSQPFCVSISSDAHISAVLQEDFLVVLTRNIASPSYLEQTKQTFFGMVKVKKN